ncbi:MULTISPECIES: Imm8 family immunity protein [Priestia]|jgi:hypothetical protein|uniref:Imm8 family immunity protein n=1 Tax=Priestia TaxID=2800373 RepID=UPI000E2F1EB8|nr:Imm8 family immunity protein [Priestia megaterium]MBW0933819.1 immunity 8 family protein [Priestia megaterium]MED3928768.1 Imm8 family immunity protein [Priestia megaterium]RFB32374.1 hypothetical protein DZB86_30410 [Bacillus sp. RC]
MLSLELFNLTSIDEVWGDDPQDFWIELEADIGIKNDEDSAEIFTIYAVSPLRLNTMLETADIELGRGFFIMNDFNIKKIEERLKKLILHCGRSNWSESAKIINRYAIWEYES